MDISGKTPVISIVIPVHNKWELTEACLNSIKENTQPGICQVLVMDNGSTDATMHEIKRKFQGIIYLRDERKMSYAVANNYAVRHVDTPLLLLLNNDTVVTAGWLQPLVDKLLSDPAIAAAGPKLLYPNGLVQHAGVVFSYDGFCYHYGARWKGDHPEVNKVRDFQAITAACLLCRTDDFRACNGFDEVFVNGHEDIDLCLKWKSMGKRIVYVPRSVVFHLESQSEGRVTHAVHNMRQFAKRWRGTVHHDDFIIGAQTRLPKRGLQTVQVILANVVPFPHITRQIYYLLISSSCGLRILITTSNMDNHHIQALKALAPFVTVVYHGDQVSLQQWIGRYHDDPDLRGIFVLTRASVRPYHWEKNFTQCSEQDLPLVPMVSHANGMQGIMQYACNVPVYPQRQMRDLVQKVNERLGPSIPCCCKPLTDAVYFPAPYLDNNGMKPLTALVLEGVAPDMPCAIVPQCAEITKKDSPVPSEYRFSVVLVVNEHASAEVIRDLKHLQEMISPTGAELIVYDNGTYGEVRLQLRTLVINGVRIIRSAELLSIRNARFAASQAATGRLLVFSDMLLNGTVFAHALTALEKMAESAPSGEMVNLGPVYAMKRTEYVKLASPERIRKTVMC